MKIFILGFYYHQTLNSCVDFVVGELRIVCCVAVERTQSTWLSYSNRYLSIILFFCNCFFKKNENAAAIRSPVSALADLLHQLRLVCQQSQPLVYFHSYLIFASFCRAQVL